MEEIDIVTKRISYFKDRASAINNKDFKRIFDFLGATYEPKEILESLIKLGESVEFWKREFDLELAHTKHAEEHIVELEKKIAELETKLTVAVQYEISHKLRTGQFEAVDKTIKLQTGNL